MKIHGEMGLRNFALPWRAVRILLLSIMLVSPLCAKAQWVQDSSPYYGYLSLAVMGDNLIAVCGGEVFRSTDLGNTWLDGNNGIEYTSDATMLYPFGPDLFVLTGFNLGVGISKDTGKSWYPRNEKGYLSENLADLISFSDTLLASCGPGGLWRSTDTGLNWTKIPYDSAKSYLGGEQSPRALAASGGYVFAGCDTGGVFRSSDGGSTWKNVLSLPKDTPVRCMAAMGGYIFAGVGSRWTSVGYVYRSTNYGETWEISSNGLPLDGWPVAFLTIDSEIYVADGGVFRSTDSGTTWINVDDSIITRGVSALATGNGYLFAGGAYLYRRPLSDFDKSGVAPGNIPNPSSISVFPNPASQSFHVISGTAGTLRLFDLLGRIRAEANDDGTGAKLDVSKLEPGTYFLRIGNQSATVEVAH